MLFVAFPWQPYIWWSWSYSSVNGSPKKTDYLTHGRHSPRLHCRDGSGWLGLPRVWCTGGRSTPRTSGSVGPLARIPSHTACILTRHPSAPVLHLLHNRLQYKACDVDQCTITLEDSTLESAHALTRLRANSHHEKAEAKAKSFFDIFVHSLIFFAFTPTFFRLVWIGIYLNVSLWFLYIRAKTKPWSLSLLKANKCKQ